MIPKKLLKHLENNKIKHELISHRTVYTAYDLAATAKTKLKEIGKGLLVKFNKPFIDGTKPYAIALVGADKNIDLKKLAKLVSDTAVKLNKELRLQKPAKGKKPLIDIYNKIRKIDIPKEKIMKDKFKVKPGAMSAFGSLHKLPVFIDKALKGNIVLSSGSFIESVKMKVGDFAKLENAFIGNFSAVKKAKKSQPKAGQPLAGKVKKKKKSQS